MVGITNTIDAAPAVPLGQDIKEEINTWADVLPQDTDTQSLLSLKYFYGIPVEAEDFL